MQQSIAYFQRKWNFSSSLWFERTLYTNVYDLADGIDDDCKPIH